MRVEKRMNRINSQPNWPVAPVFLLIRLRFNVDAGCFVDSEIWTSFLYWFPFASLVVPTHSVVFPFVRSVVPAGSVPNGQRTKPAQRESDPLVCWLIAGRCSTTAVARNCAACCGGIRHSTRTTNNQTTTTATQPLTLETTNHTDTHAARFHSSL